jgi:hypothetical protein
VVVDCFLDRLSLHPLSPVNNLLCLYRYVPALGEPSRERIVLASIRISDFDSVFIVLAAKDTRSQQLLDFPSVSCISGRLLLFVLFAIRNLAKVHAAA